MAFIKPAILVAALILAGHALVGDAAAKAGELRIYGGMSSEMSDDLGGTEVASLITPRHVSLEKKIVAFDRDLAPGSILIQTHAHRLYFVLPGGQAILYPVGVGRDGFTWSGQNVISKKAAWPDWRPPARMIAREANRGRYLPDLVKGGEGNPLGARALYIGETEFRIHGTTEPGSIGRSVSSGCIRMLNAHVIDLYEQVTVGATVVVE